MRIIYARIITHRVYTSFGVFNSDCIRTLSRIMGHNLWLIFIISLRTGPKKLSHRKLWGKLRSKNSDVNDLENTVMDPPFDDGTIGRFSAYDQMETIPEVKGFYYVLFLQDHGNLP